MARGNLLKVLAVLSVTLCVAHAELAFLFTATCNGSSNIPALTDAQTGGATAYIDLVWEGDSFSWYMDVTGITNLTMAHIHLGNSTTNGPPIVPLLPLNAPMSEFANGSLDMYPSPISGTFTFSTNFTSEDFLPPLAGLDAEDFVQLLASEETYVNLHTTAYPAGELRGQLIPELDAWFE